MHYVISNILNFSPANILTMMAGSLVATALHAHLDLFVQQQLIPPKERTNGVAFGENALN
ncbi:hypothetical protein EI94DRAFT_1806496 [Lactarius quietus]|nr:hypothetical protein EI94DRAFT_1806496 [Lactarius quietus]